MFINKFVSEHNHASQSTSALQEFSPILCKIPDYGRNMVLCTRMSSGCWCFKKDIAKQIYSRNCPKKNKEAGIDYNKENI